MSNLRQSIRLIGFCREYSKQSSVAVIKVPTYVEKYVAALKARKEKRRLAVLRKIFRRGDLNVPVITASNKEYNFYLGQEYNRHFPVPIISKYWLKTKSAGEKFTIMPWNENPSLPRCLEKIPVETLYSDEESMSYYRSTFEQLNLSQTVIEAVKQLGFQYPTPIQVMTIPKILTHDHVACVAETGCGKTLTYVIPIIDSMLKCKDKQERFPNTPLALIVSPGRELAEQIATVAYQLGELCGVRVKLLIPEGTKHGHLKPTNHEPYDVLVATFGTLCHLSKAKGPLNLSHLRHLVLDEADTLLDESFRSMRNRFMSRIMTHDTIINPEGKEFGAQFVFVSATMPRNIEHFFNDNITGRQLEYCVSPYAHKVLPHVQQKFIRVNNANRAGILLEIVKKDVEKETPCIVFCNNSMSCQWLGHFLKNNDVPCVLLHSNLSYSERSDAFERFQSGDMDLLCCTDLASRGLDTQRAKHIVNFDFPNNMSDYILRAGRAGRVGTNHGRVTNLIVSVPGVHVVQNIEMAMRKSSKLDNVDANIKRKLQKLHGPK